MTKVLLTANLSTKNEAKVSYEDRGYVFGDEFMNTLEHMMGNYLQ